MLLLNAEISGARGLKNHVRELPPEEHEGPLSLGGDLWEKGLDHGAGVGEHLIERALTGGVAALDAAGAESSGGDDGLDHRIGPAARVQQLVKIRGRARLDPNRRHDRHARGLERF